MSTALANPTEMTRRGAPRLIHSDDELAECTEALFHLTAKADPTPDEEEAIELMTLQVERYEQERYPAPEAEPADVLRFLLERNSLSQRDIAAEFGSESTTQRKRTKVEKFFRAARRSQVSKSRPRASGNI